MERLTHKARYEAGYKLNKGVKEWRAADRLGAYENTGLTPEQIRELKERDTEHFCKTSIFDHESVVCKCGNDIEKDSGFDFCPYCGNRIKLED